MPNVIITGSGRRIGRALALRFAEKGWGVGVHYNASLEMAKKTIAEVEEHGVLAVSAQADLRDGNALRRAYETYFDRFGSIDVLVNNAGVYPKPTSLSEITDEIWDDTLEVNLKAQLTSCKIFAELTGSSPARIINFASLGAFEIWRGRIPYNVSKTAALRLSEALARELAPRISVNCVSPGVIYIPDEPASEPLRIRPETIPAQRYGSTDDIFEATYFFATATQYVTGQNLKVDGGLNLI
ncbi:MAG: SDR family NAD(P)-dependent oxidoreductase [Chloroflexota bacterium]